MKNKKLLLALACMGLAVATQAAPAPVVFDFQLSPGQTPPGVDLGTSSATFTKDGLSITASSFDTPADTATPPDLFSKTDPSPDETGLGLANDGDHEIDAAHFIQLDFSKVRPATSIIITISSIQGTAQGFNPPEDANVWATTAAGTIASPPAALFKDLNGNDGVVQTVDVTALVNAGNFIDIQASGGNVLIETVAVTPLPPTASCVSITAVQGTPISPVTMTGSGGCGGPYTFTATGLPPGLTMSTGGTISGTPTASGTFPYTVTVTDNCGNTGTVNCSVTVSPSSSPCTINGVTISGTSWNSFPVPSGTSPLVWVHMHIGKPSGIPTTGTTTVDFTGVTLTLNGTPYSIPDGVLIFDSSNPSTITTSFTGGKWVTLINPNFMSDEMFFTGAAIPVTASIAAGAKADLTYNVASSVTGLSFSWQWSAAVYTFWPTDWNNALIQPFHSSFHAGTPLNTTVQKSLIQGPRGGGGSNFTGSWSATGTAACPH